MKLEKMHILGIVTGLIVAGASYYLFSGNNIMYFLLVVAFLIMTSPFLKKFLGNQNKDKEKEEKFLEFARDLVENVKSGTPISKSIMNLSNRNYGSLTNHVGKLANQLSLGITLNKAFATFAKDTKNTVISRAVGLISEAERSGGKIETVLESVANSVNQIEELKKERKAMVSNLITQGYMIFIIFIIIMLVMQFSLLPMISDLGGDSGAGLNTTSTNKINPDEFSRPLFIMIIVQSLFAGLVIGKVSEGSIKSGIKHSFILLGITLLITTGANVLLG